MNEFKERLRGRTLGVSNTLLELCKELPKSPSNTVSINQVNRSVTAIGANCITACRAKSRADFINKMHIVEEECDETIYWVNLLKLQNPGLSEEFELVRKELSEIIAIVVSALKTAKRNRGKDAGKCGDDGMRGCGNAGMME